MNSLNGYRITRLATNIKMRRLRDGFTIGRDRKKGAEALKSIEKFFTETERTFAAEGILDEAFLVSLAVQGKKAAYKWLVRAHIVRHGWQSYWTSSKEINRRLEWAAKYYKDKWRDFIADTSSKNLIGRSGVTILALVFDTSCAF